MPVQEPGLRLARPLPYNLAVDAKVTAGRVELDFAGFGSIGAVFHVVSTVDLTGPWDYTVGAGRKLTGGWTPAGAYSYEVHGPNGFLREVAGSAAVAGLDVTARHLGSGQGQVLLSFVNHGATSVEITLSDAYGNQGGHATIRIRPGGSVEQTVHTDRANGWYDVSVKIGSDSGYLRRFAGHVETGRPSTSDPAIATS
jgi:phospholipase C